MAKQFQAGPPPTEKQPKKRPKPPKADRDLWVFERQAFGLGYATVAGVDEAGRGAWAGPGVAGGGGPGCPPFLWGERRSHPLAAGGGSRQFGFILGRGGGVGGGVA